MEIKYALLPDRVKAAFIDSFVLVGMIYFVTEIFSMFETVPNYMKIIASVIIFLLYEPIFISSFGGTIGHSYSGLSVKQENNPEKNVIFPIAIIRFLLKALLGWISLLTITGNEKRKAIHDFAANSIVVENKK